MHKARNSNIELLRILAMLLILAHHFAVHGVLLSADYSQATAQLFFTQILVSGGKMGVDIFIVITGYFLCKSEFKLRRITPVILATWTYSMVFFVLHALHTHSLSFWGTMMSLFPVQYAQYWFVSAYILLVILSPVLNAFIRQVDGRKLVMLTLALFTFFFILPVFLKMRLDNDRTLRFIVLYLLGANLRLGNFAFLEKHARATFWSTILIMLLSITGLDLLGNLRDSAALVGGATHFVLDNSPFAALAAVALVAATAKMPARSYPWVNRISGCMFGIYLIHDNAYVRPYLWGNLLHVERLWQLSAGKLVLAALVIILGIFAACLLVEFIRGIVMQPLTRWLADDNSWLNRKFAGQRTRFVTAHHKA